MSENATYEAERLSMERVDESAFGPQDRIGQLTMRILDLEDSRAKLELYGRAGLTRMLGPLGLPERESRVGLDLLAGPLDHDHRYAHCRREPEQRADELGAVLRLDHLVAG